MLVCNLKAVDACGVVRYCILRNSGNLCVATELSRSENVLPAVGSSDCLVLNLNTTVQPDINGSWALTVAIVGVVPELLLPETEIFSCLVTLVQRNRLVNSHLPDQK